MTGDSLSRRFDTAKAASHFEVVRRFADTFAPDELFPDVDWGKISAEQWSLVARCKAAIVYLTIGQDYARTGALDYARTAFDMAWRQLQDCARSNPANLNVKQLLDKCESLRTAYFADSPRAAETAVEATIG
jgi:hypothetical protein